MGRHQGAIWRTQVGAAALDLKSYKQFDYRGADEGIDEEDDDPVDMPD